MTPKNWRRCKFASIIIAALIGTFLFGLSIWVNDSIDTIMTRIIGKKAVLREDSESFKNWRNSSVDIYFSVTLFNLTNLEQVLKDNVNPHYNEIGPYVYLQKRVKESYKFSEDGNTLEFKEKRFYHFQPELSLGDPHKDIIVQLYLVGNTLYHKDHGWLKNMVLSGANEPVFRNMTAHEFIWDNHDPFLSVKEIRGGLFQGKNDTTGLTNAINTGLSDISLFGKVVKSEDKTELNIWSSDQANMINGTDGSMFSPGVRRIQSLYVFAADVCRSFRMIYKKDVKATNDQRITLYQYAGAPEQGQNASVNPFNKGFCVKEPIGPECPPAGLMDLSACRAKDGNTVPLYASQPRFNKVDPSVIRNIEGITFPTEDDQTILNIHPETGYPLEVTKKLQFNMYVNTDKVVSSFKRHYGNMTGEYYMPIFWIKESAQASSEILGNIYEKVNGGRQKLLKINYVLMGISICILLVAFSCAIFMVFFNEKRSKNKSPVSTNSTPLSNRSSDIPDYKTKDNAADEEKDPFIR